MSVVTMRQMLEAGIHFGHQSRYWNPKMSPYIFGERSKIHIINLEKTLPMFNDAMNFISHTAGNRGKILFVGTKYAASDIIAEEAMRAEMPYVNHRWLGGMLTNYKTIRKSIKRLRDIEAQQERRGFDSMTKKERLQIQREYSKLDRSLGGIKNMGGLPDIIFIIDVGHEHIAVAEARKLGIPIIGIVDTNTNPDGIDYLIPGNDDSLRSIRLYCKTAADIIIEARKSIVEPEKHAKEKAEPKVTTKTPPKSQRKVVTKVASKVDDTAADAATQAKEKESKATAAEKPATKAAATKKAAETNTAAEKKPAAKTAATQATAAEKPATKAAATKKSAEAKVADDKA